MTDVAAMMAALRAQYRAALPEKVAAIAWAMEHGDGDAIGLAHRLAGSAGSYGEATVGEHARAIEDALRTGDVGAAQTALAALQAAVREG